MFTQDVLTGYRIRLSWPQIWASIFLWHNETLNIWTHLLGGGVFLWVFLNEHGLPNNVDLGEGHAQLERWPIFLFLTTAMLCLFFSTAFHWFYCYSRSIYALMVRVDYSGVALLIAGSYFPWLYYNFYCLESWQTFYLSSVVVLGGATFLFSLLEFFSQPRFNVLRVFTFIGFGAFCVVRLPQLFFTMSTELTILFFASGIFRSFRLCTCCPSTPSAARQ
jgi:adiponectin receptor